MNVQRELLLGAMSLGVAWAAGGCLADLDESAGGESPVDESEVESNLVTDNGISLNGISLNGISLNGISLNGVSLNGINLGGVMMNNVPLSSVMVRDTQLQGTTSTGTTLSGAAMVGARMRGRTSSQQLIDLRIDGSATLPAPNSDVRVYAISYATSAGWQPLCPQASGANEGILYSGVWNLTTGRHQSDSSVFTMSCRGATFAKCTELGYKGDSLLDTYHQACTRALRADYCGDGQSHTVNGTIINIYDKLGRQADTQAWAVESNWTTEGAICIGKARLATPLTLQYVPQCMVSRAAIACATGWPGSVLIRTEVNR